MLEPWANWLAYGLRVASLQSYSGRISSELAAAARVRRVRLAEVFFIFASFTRSGEACADDTNHRVAALGEENREQSVP